MKRPNTPSYWVRLAIVILVGLGLVIALGTFRSPGSTALAAVTAPTFVQEKDSQITSGTAVSVTLPSTTSGDQSAPIDVAAAAVGSSGSLSSGSAVTTNATDLLFGAGLLLREPLMRSFCQ